MKYQDNKHNSWLLANDHYTNRTAPCINTSCTRQLSEGLQQINQLSWLIYTCHWMVQTLIILLLQYGDVVYYFCVMYMVWTYCVSQMQHLINSSHDNLLWQVVCQCISDRGATCHVHWSILLRIYRLLSAVIVNVFLSILKNNFHQIFCECFAVLHLKSW